MAHKGDCHLCTNLRVVWYTVERSLVNLKFEWSSLPGRSWILYYEAHCAGWHKLMCKITFTFFSLSKTDPPRSGTDQLWSEACKSCSGNRFTPWFFLRKSKNSLIRSWCRPFYSCYRRFCSGVSQAEPALWHPLLNLSPYLFKTAEWWRNEQCIYKFLHVLKEKIFTVSPPKQILWLVDENESVHNHTFWRVSRDTPVQIGTLYPSSYCTMSRSCTQLQGPLKVLALETNFWKCLHQLVHVSQPSHLCKSSRSCVTGKQCW